MARNPKHYNFDVAEQIDIENDYLKWKCAGLRKRLYYVIVLSTASKVL